MKSITLDEILYIIGLTILVITLLSSCENKVEEQQCNYPEGCFIVIEAVPDGDVFYKFRAENLCTKQRYYLRTRADIPDYFLLNQVYCDENVNR